MRPRWGGWVSAAQKDYNLAMRAGFIALMAFTLSLSMPGAFLEYQRIFRGNQAVTIGAVASDPDGNVYVAGTTSAFDFAVKNAYQARNPASAIVVSEDAGRTWRPLGFVPDLPITGVNAPAVHPKDSRLLIATGVYGIYRSTDGGESWSTVVDLNQPQQRQRIGYLDQAAFDPHDPSIVYASSTGGVLKSADTGITWTLLTNGLTPGSCCVGAGLAVDPHHPGRIIYTINERAYVSQDAGATWRLLALPPGLRRPVLLTDPHIAGRWYLYSYEGAWRSTDAGDSWSLIREDSGLFIWLQLDPSLPGRIYALSQTGLFRSSDGGGSWTQVIVDPPGDPMNGTAPFTFAVQPGNPDYLVVSGQAPGVFGRTVNLISTDGGQSWQPMGVSRPFHGFRFDPSRPSRLFAAGTPTADAFVVKLNPAGEIVYSTYLGGQGTDSATALAVDGQGNLYVAGETTSPDFPAATAKHYPGHSPSLFAAKLDPAGRPIYVTLVGDGRDDTVRSIAVDSSGRLYLTGRTVSPLFPLTSNAIAGFSEAGGGFAARLSPDGATFEYATALDGSAESIALHPEGGFMLAGLMKVDASEAGLVWFGEDGALLQSSRVPVTPVKLLITAGGRFFVAGTASISSPPPVTPGAFQTGLSTNCTHDSGGVLTFKSRQAYMTDLWVAELDRGGNVVSATLLGGSCRDEATDLALAADGSLWVAGQTYSQQLPVTDPLFGPPAEEYSVPFVAHLDASLSRLLFSTWLDYGSNARLASSPGEGVTIASGSPSRGYSGMTEGTLRHIIPGPSAELAVRRIASAFDGSSGPVAPLEIVRIEIPSLTPDAEINLGLNPAEGAPTELGGVAIEFNGMPARLLEVWRGGVVCITPEQLRGQSMAAVMVRQGSARSSAFYTPVNESKLTLFQQVRHEDGSLNSPDNPAPTGSLITFFFTGAGSLDSQIDLIFNTTPGESTTVPPARPVEGFVDGFYFAQAKVPATSGTYRVMARLTPAPSAPPVYPPLISSVTISVR